MKAKAMAILLPIASVTLTFLVINFVHFRYLPVSVVLYDTLADAAIATVFAGVLWFGWLRNRFELLWSEVTLSLAVGFLLSFLYAVMVPTVIDRSLSIYFLEKLDQRGGRIKASAWDGILKEEFFREHRLVDIRLTEQLNSGTIKINDGCVELTERGKLIASFTRFYRTNILPKHRDIMGKLTDDLTEPFRNSQTLVPFACD